VTALATAQPTLQRARAYISRLLGTAPDYQPDPFDRTAVSTQALRACADRFDAIAARLPEGEPLSVLDVGCHVGYFTFRMAERGGVCLGLDRSAAALDVARRRATKHGVRNVAFLEIDLSPSWHGALPDADLVLCLSVFHHWVRQFGSAGATSLLERVASHARRHLAFETGQPGEAEMKWAAQLDFMLPDPAAWVRSTLGRLGFSVDAAGPFPSGVSTGHRHLFVARRAAHRKFSDLGR
jgi:SAM-dependent methyltransferase